jgi:biopolymer transport protein TolR
MNWARKKRMRSQGFPEITLTPLIDTALTLLIIFMVTAPMIQNSLNVQLPKSKSPMDGAVGTQELIVSIDKMGDIFVNEEKVTLGTLGSQLTEQLNKAPSKMVAVKADEAAVYRTIIGVIDVIKYVEGVEGVSLVVEPIT